MIVYLVIAGGFFLAFYVIFKKAMENRKIQRVSQLGNYRREVFYSLSSSLIFVIVPSLLVTLPFFQFNAYQQWGGYFHHWVFIPVFLLIMFFLHDAYFYWTHRLMHHRLLFRWFHRVHHRSVSTSPWTSFSFSPLEALVQVAIVPIFSLIIPVSPFWITAFFVFSLIYNVYGHLGYELYPKRFQHHWLGRWVNTAVHHDLHHQRPRGSYGLYLTLWDRLMGTMNQDYDQQFDAVTRL
jgi:Delta7-sterol 5-desaturase